MQLNDSERLKVLLLEYQEICTYQRHEDTTKWTITALTFTGAAAVIAWTATNLPYLIGLALLLSSGLVWIGSRAFSQLQMGSRIRLQRAEAIEGELGMHNHELIAAHDVRNGYKGDLPYPGGFAPILMTVSRVVAAGLLIVGVFALFAAPFIAAFSRLCGRQ